MHRGFHVSKTLLLYFSLYGHTGRIAGRIRERMTALGEDVEVESLIENPGVDPARYDRIILGACIRNGKYKPPVWDFIRKHKSLLDERPSAFFSVNLVARKPGKNTPETNPYTKQFVQKSPWQPDLLGVFGGDLDYQRYGTMDRNIIRFIMWITRGPTDPKTKVEYTNWDEVDRFAERAARLGKPEAA
jgi:menaquinone-dependent protoporphyrinogen oxidase